MTYDTNFIRGGQKVGKALGIITVLCLSVFLGVSSQAMATVIYSEDFEDGIANGFTLNGLWHVTNNFPASGVFALGYVQNESAGGVPNGDFDIGNVSATSFGPAIAIPILHLQLVAWLFLSGEEYQVTIQ